MKKQVVLGLITGVILSIGITGCTEKAPSCNDKKVQTEVLKLSKEAISSKIGEKAVNTISFSLKDIKIIKENDDGSIQCSATLKGVNSNATNDIPLKYTTTIDETRKLGFKVNLNLGE